MQINSIRKPYSRKHLLIVAISAILVVTMVAALTYRFISDVNRQSEMETLKSSQPSESSKQDIINQKYGDQLTDPSLPEESTAITNEEVATGSNLSVNIDSVAQRNGRVFSVARTNDEGVCVFLFEPFDAGKPISRQVSTSNNACSTDISEGEFTYLGQWKLTVTYYNNGQKTDTSQDVTIN